MVTPTSWLPQLYQRFQRFWDRAVPAVGLALLLWATAEATGAYPREWRLFLAAALFALGLVRSEVAYGAFILLVAYPLYLISIYVAAVLLAVLILSARWAMENLGATVLVLITPVLLPWHLEATIPLLTGLWWGEWTGALAGGLAALWLKLLAGMAGQPLDLAQLSGWAPGGADVVRRFGGLNSLQTLLELVNPFANTSQGLLLHVLQVLAWGLAGLLAGYLVRQSWQDRQRVWAPLLSALPAGVVIWASYALLPRLLNPGAVETTIEGTALLEKGGTWLLASALVAAGVRGFYLYLRRPLLRTPSRLPSREGRGDRAPAEPTASDPDEASPRLEKDQPAFQWRPSDRPRTASQADDDLIMLEMD